VPNNDLARKLVVEFIGAFTLTFAGVGAIIATQGQNLVAIAFAHGLAIGLMVLAAGHISGGHYNPAVTAGVWATKRIDTTTAVGYVIAQLAGALVAAGALTLCFRDLERNATGVNLGVPAVGANLSTGNALVMEIILTFFLVFVIYGTAIDRRTPKAIAGLAIGLTITMGVFAGGAVSGAAMNPSRWFGPAIVQGDFTNFWIWIVGPLVGGVAAAWLYNAVLFEEPVDASDTEAEREAEYVDRAEVVAAVARSRRAQRRKR
jgi:aquaporin Z